MKKYYSLEKDGMTADLYIFGDITSWPWDEKDKDAYSIVKELKKLEVDSINVHINSYGGEVAEGLAIYNTLKNSNFKVTTYCDGFACSAASVIFMAGDERIMNEASLLMIHNAWSWACGNANDFRKCAEDLEKITQASINAYMSKVKISEEEVKKLMDEETWITADEAVNYGFATKTEEQDDDTIKQSAMKSIVQKIVGSHQEKKIYLDEEKMAKSIVEKVKEMLDEKQKNNDQIEDAGWGVFFNGGK